jgi:hypothetical protein
LSRCRSLEGLVLRSRIMPSSIHTDERIVRFSEKESDLAELESILARERIRYESAQLSNRFDHTKIVRGLLRWRELISESKSLPDRTSTICLCDNLLKRAEEQSAVAEKFKSQLTRIYLEGNKDLLRERLSKALPFFCEPLLHEFIQPVHDHAHILKHASKIKSYLIEVRQLERLIENVLQQLSSIAVNGEPMWKDPRARTELPASVVPKHDKKKSYVLSVMLYKEGNSLNEIAAMRNLSERTIEGHLAQGVADGEIKLGALVTDEKVQLILSAITKAGRKLSDIKAVISEDVSYAEIKAVLSYLDFVETHKEAV